MLHPVWWLLIAAVAIVLAVYLAGKIWGKSPPVPKELMPQNQIVMLVAYLMLLGVGLVFMLVSLNSLDFPATPVVPQEVEIATSTPSPTPTPAANTTTAAATNPTASPAPAPNPTPVVPVLERIFPQAMLASTVVGSPPTPKLTIYGKNFSAESKVRFNLKQVPIEYISDNLLRASLDASDLVGKGAITVDVKNADGAVSNAIPVPIEKPLVKLNVFFVAYPVISREVQLLLLVIFAGALGSYLHAVMSLADYISKTELTSSYFWWYISRPFLGMSMALVFYAVLRGGFLAGTPADANVVNPFGVVTIGALVGMFSYKAATKLGEIFDVIFKAGPPAPDENGDNANGANGNGAAADAGAGATDASAADAGAGDAAAGDAAAGDASAGDSGAADSGAGDAGAADAGAADAGATDAGAGDAGAGDAGAGDAGTADTSAGDASATDAGAAGSASADADDTATAGIDRRRN